MKYARIGFMAAAAAMILAGCGGGGHSGSGASSAPATSSTPAFDMVHIQSAAARQIEADQRGKVLPGSPHVSCPSTIEPKAGAKFECNIHAQTTTALNDFSGTATVVLNDPAGKTFSLDYTMSSMAGLTKTTLKGTAPSVG
jgi:hypothetical protein